MHTQSEDHNDKSSCAVSQDHIIHPLNIQLILKSLLSFNVEELGRGREDGDEKEMRKTEYMTGPEIKDEVGIIERWGRNRGRYARRGDKRMESNEGE